MDYKWSNDMMINEWKIKKDSEERGRGLLDVLARHLSGETEESHAKPICV
jgi:hypothetical protein